MPARAPAVQSGPSHDAQLPSGPFFTTTEQRVALARERFFEEGVRPSGLVPELVIQSWTRCVGARRTPSENVAFEPVTKARIATALARNRQLIEAARDDLLELDAALAGTGHKAILTSHDGVVVHATPTAPDEGRLMPIVARVGVDLGEATIGTGAPGVAARTGKACVVKGAEHFFSDISLMYCAAAPIRDAHGNIAGVLDLSSEAKMFSFSAAAMVGLYATTIENRLLESQSRTHVLLRFQSSPGLLHTPVEGLAAIDDAGRVRWVNRAGNQLLAGAPSGVQTPMVEQMFGLGIEALLELAHSERLQMHRLPGGLGMWIQARRPEKPGPRSATAQALPPQPAAVPEPETVSTAHNAAPADAEPTTLVDAHRRLLDSTLQECGGNVSRAARQLGVSRGLIYRHLRERRADGT